MTNSSSHFALTESVIAAAVSARAFPGATIEVGRSAGVLWRHGTGRHTYDQRTAATTEDTIFDLASLTKVMATVPLVARQLTIRQISLDLRLADVWPEWRSASRLPITVRHLLDHSSGLPAHARLWENERGREGYFAAISALPLEQAAGTVATYSDLGFILLGFLLADVGGPFDEQLSRFVADAGVGPLSYNPPGGWRPRIAPTEFDPWRNRLLVGEVHDENAAALGGVAGHAGLFGTVGAVGAFARLVLASFTRETVLGPPALMSTLATRTDVPGSSRALGWDTMLPTSSCGTRLSPRAIGHTGFTGTSLWIDPEQDLYVAFLTNRVHPTRTNDSIRAVRPRVHDAVMEDLR